MSTLLIVDDNEKTLYMLQVLLSSKGFQVERASNGAEALERARRAPPDMIISDILMPVMDGFALCRAWKEDERLKDIPFVFYTATYTDPKDEDFGLSLGADRFIVKPIEPDKLLALLWETIKNRKADKPVAPRQTVEEAEYYKEYNAALIRKLEDKMLQLEEANRILERDIAERKRAEAEQAALFEIAKVIAGLVDLNEILNRVHQRVATLLPCDRVVTYYWDAARNAYRALAWHGVPSPLEPDTIALEFHSGQPVAERLLGGETVL
ncbi:MAG: response regulator, partial [Candidatus Binatia bacterium]